MVQAMVEIPEVVHVVEIVQVGLSRLVGGGGENGKEDGEGNEQSEDNDLTTTENHSSNSTIGPSVSDIPSGSMSLCKVSTTSEAHLILKCPKSYKHLLIAPCKLMTKFIQEKKFLTNTV